LGFGKYFLKTGSWAERRVSFLKKGFSPAQKNITESGNEFP